MLKIATYLDKSSINGIGVFAAEPIERGQTVWEFNPAVDFVFTARQWKKKLGSVTAHAREALRRYSYKSDNKFYLCNDNSQFMNHSESLNNIANNNTNDSMFAARKIAIGEELLCNYFEYSDEDDYHLAIIRSSSLELPGKPEPRTIPVMVLVKGLG